jgi:group I intron endonuclease
VDLRDRLRDYYSEKKMETILKISRSAIYSSLRKYGISMFKLEILVYCEPEKCVKLEQKYINFFKPPYNILKIAGSQLGVVRSEETRAKISASKKGENNPMFGKTGENHPVFGKTRSEETKQRISLSMPNSKTIQVTDLETNTTVNYVSITAASRL